MDLGCTWKLLFIFILRMTAIEFFVLTGMHLPSSCHSSKRHKLYFIQERRSLVSPEIWKESGWKLISSSQECHNITCRIQLSVLSTTKLWCLCYFQISQWPATCGYRAIGLSATATALLWTSLLHLKKSQGDMKTPATSWSSFPISHIFKPEIWMWGSSSSEHAHSKTKQMENCCPSVLSEEL